ncbi:unnamed protein product [Clonostachys byssicola]|uniref:Uncharacterized protein n=1 Tax=Clonostachys byssicola TaxID=160290 RepID=A0A9N9Y2V6_9HYPO|nr:unnamed protein product [Clonostachys byssicola]
MMLHSTRPQSPSPTPFLAHHVNPAPAPTTQDDSSAAVKATKPSRKRKAQSQDNERLSKRLSLLNLEQNGSKLYVPVENPTAADSSGHPAAQLQPRPEALAQPRGNPDQDSMQLDDSKYKVYIYNIDDELSSDESDAEDGKLIFLPDIEKHLKQNRIPPHILANSDGELAGMQMVLYRDPQSLTLPKEQDSVRKAILETRHRLREKQRQEREGASAAPVAAQPLGEQALVNPIAATDDDEVMDID